MKIRVRLLTATAMASPPMTVSGTKNRPIPMSVPSIMLTSTCPRKKAIR